MRHSLAPVLMLSLLASATLTISRAADEKAAVPAATAAAVPVPAVDPTILIADLRENPPGIFSYGTWKDHLAVSPNGLSTQGSSGAQGDGGLGRNIEPALDLSTVAFIEVALAVGQRNDFPAVTVALNDADGTQVSAKLHIEQIVPGLPVWLRVRRENFTRVGGQDGKDGQMDWSKVAQWHLQGDWNMKKPVHVMFIAVRARK